MALSMPDDEIRRRHKWGCPFLQVNNWCVDIRTCKKCGKWEGNNEQF